MMSDPLENGQTETRRRGRLPFWATLLIWLSMAIGLTIHNWLLVKQDASIVPRETSVFGVIDAESYGGRGSHYVSYSFNYEGRAFRGHAEHYAMIGQTVAVFLDSDDPPLNSLTEYHQKMVEDDRIMVGGAYASLGLAAILACVLASKL
jgi:hypothetical protein